MRKYNMIVDEEHSSIEKGIAVLEDLMGKLRVPVKFHPQTLWHKDNLAVSDEVLIEAQMRLSRLEGTFACPEGGATLAALEVLSKKGWVIPDDRVVLFNTGTGLKYPEIP